MNSSDLLPNPHAKIALRVEGDVVVGATIAAPLRGEGIRVSTFTGADHAEIVTLLVKLAGAREERGEEVELAVTDAIWAQLAEAGFLVSADRLPRAPRFTCPLELDDEGTTGPLDAAFALAPTLQEASEGGNGPFADGQWYAVAHPVTGLRHTFGVRAEDAAWFARVRSGELAPEAIAAPRRAALARAGVLVAARAIDPRRAAWAAQIEEARAQFASRGYVAVDGAIPADAVRATRAYYRELSQDGALQRGDTISRDRYVKHDEALARHWHTVLAPVVERVAGRPLKPSYSYFAAYEPGATLRRHVDREQCEVSLTLLLDYEPAPSDRSPWPLLLFPDGRNAVEIFQRPGELLVYRGTEIPHMRNALPDGHRSRHVFFHYVSVDFTGPLT